MTYLIQWLDSVWNFQADKYQNCYTNAKIKTPYYDGSYDNNKNNNNNNNNNNNDDTHNVATHILENYFHFYDSGRIMSILDLKKKEDSNNNNNNNNNNNYEDWHGYFVEKIPICCCGITTKKYEYNKEKQINFKKYYKIQCKRLKNLCGNDKNAKISNNEFIETQIDNFEFLK